jgi:hypothetical protein
MPTTEQTIVALVSKINAYIISLVLKTDSLSYADLITHITTKSSKSQEQILPLLQSLHDRKILIGATALGHSEIDSDTITR